MQFHADSILSSEYFPDKYACGNFIRTGREQFISSRCLQKHSGSDRDEQRALKPCARVTSCVQSGENACLHFRIGLLENSILK
jgi:hypothetical protein